MKNNSGLFKSIENRILFALIIVGIIPLLLTFIFNNFIISDSLLKLEKQNIYTLQDQTNLIIEEKLNELEMTVKDEAIWEDAYDKIEGKDTGWFKKNFSQWLPRNFDVDLTVVLNMHSQIIDAYGLKNNDVSELLNISSISNILKFKYTPDHSAFTKGILMYGGKPYLFCAGPILRSESEPNPRGLLLIGKSISPNYIRGIENVLKQKLIISFGDTFVCSDSNDKSIYKYVNADKDNNSISLINNEIVGSTYITKVLNAPKARLIIIMKRDTFLQTKQRLDLGSGGIIFLAFITILLAGFLLKKYTTMPLKKFEDQIYKMSQNNVVSYVKTEGPLEVERLTETFNLMVNKLNEQSIENQNLKSELEYDRLRNEFLTNISHEFKTPLNVIFSATQLMELLLKDNSQNNMHIDINKHVHVMKQNCFRLLRLVNNLIDITKIDSEAYQIHLRNYNIVNLVEDITLSVAEYTERMNIFVGFDTDIEEKIMACDPDQIERIILNLLSNAIKFTKPGGEVWVIISDFGNMLQITVKDTGVGIPEDQLDIIFERFRQVDRSLTRNHEGSGIGLTIVKSLVEMHNGTIHVKSEYGKGSEFIIELPVTTVANKAEKNDNFTEQHKVERINIEFSDIYSDS